MSWGAIQYLKVTKEQNNAGVRTYGIYSTKTTPIANADYLWPRLDASNSFTMRAVPERYIIRSADSYNEKVQTGSGRTAVAGTLNTLVYPSQVSFWLSAALDLVAADLDSFSLEFFDTKKTHRFLGGKIRRLRLSCSAEAEAQPLRASIEWIAQQSAPTPPALTEPACTVFPNEQPYIHIDSDGFITINGVVRVNYANCEIDIENILQPKFYEKRYLKTLYHCGRNFTFRMKGSYDSTTDRDALEAITTQVNSKLKFVKGANNFEINLHSANYFATVDDDLPLDNAAEQSLVLETYRDPVTCSSVTWTATPDLRAAPEGEASEGGEEAAA